MKKPIILLGAGGHARVLIDLIALLDGNIIGGYTDDAEPASGSSIRFLGHEDTLSNQYAPDDVLLVNGLGFSPSHCARQQVFENFKQQGYQFATLVHPSASVASTVQLAEGVQVMAGAILQTNSQVEVNSLINTGAKIDHDCQLATHVNVSPGATLCGSVQVASGAYIGAGATVANNVVISENAIIGCGASIVRNVAANTCILPAATRASEREFTA